MKEKAPSLVFHTRRSTMTRERRDSLAQRMPHLNSRDRPINPSSRNKDLICLDRSRRNSRSSLSTDSTWSRRCRDRRSWRWRDCGEVWVTCPLCTSTHSWMTTWEHSPSIDQESSELGLGRTVPELPTSLTFMFSAARSMASIFQSSTKLDSQRKIWRLVRINLPPTSSTNWESHNRSEDYLHQSITSLAIACIWDSIHISII